MTTICQAPDVLKVFGAKTARTFCYGFLGVLFPLYLSDLGVTTAGVGTAVTLTLVGSAGLTWAIRRPAERYGVGTHAIRLVARSLDGNAGEADLGSFDVARDTTPPELAATF